MAQASHRSNLPLTANVMCKRERIVLKNINYKKGLLRLWLIAIPIWFIFVLIAEGNSISQWAGYHYSLIKKHETISLAMREKDNVLKIISACKTAEKSVCSEHSNRLSYELNDRKITENKLRKCRVSDDYKGVVIAALKDTNFTGGGVGADDVDNNEMADICASMLYLIIPKFNWAGFIFVVIVPFIFPVIFFVFLWVMKGFKSSSQK